MIGETSRVMGGDDEKNRRVKNENGSQRITKEILFKVDVRFTVATTLTHAWETQ
jgi:hypothetical protein